MDIRLDTGTWTAFLVIATLLDTQVLFLSNYSDLFLYPSRLKSEENSVKGRKFSRN